MKKRILYIVLALFMCLVILTIYEAQRLKLFMDNESIEVMPLTSDQKAKDMAFMFDAIEKAYPFADLNAEIKGLTNLLELRGDFIARAYDTTNNEEFLKLVVEVTEYIRQSGHGGINLYQDYSFYHMMTQNIPKDAYLKTEYWRSVASKLKLYVHSDLKVAYKQGAYVIVEDFENEIHSIPSGSVITMVDYTPIDDYVRSLEAYQVLGFDVARDKLYAYQLFMVDAQPSELTWNVEIRKPNDEIVNLALEKKDGYRYPYENASGDNLNMILLNEKVAYFGIKSFSGEYIQDDGNKMRSFFEEYPYQLDHLIIDLRNNSGGEITYWIENLIKPMIVEVKTLNSVTAVKKSFEDRMGYHLWLYRVTTANDLLDESNDIVNIGTIKDEPSFSSKDWKVYQIVKRFEPTNRYAFNGSVILLTNQQTLSAADSYVNAVKQLGIGKVVGLHTGGWGNHYSAPMTFALPESGIIFYMDVEVALNNDGLPTSIYGTEPDVIIEPFLSPTPYVHKYSKEAILEDQWIKWVLMIFT